MLSRKDRIKLHLKAAEFNLPEFAIRGSFKIGFIKDPFVTKDHELNCIFLHVPKAAGTSLRKSFYHSKSYHIPALRYKAVRPVEFQKYFKFCFVRNPWDRILSAYEYLKVRCHADMAFPDHRWAASSLIVYHDFSDFILSLEQVNLRKQIKQYIHFRDQLDWICDSDKSQTILVDFIGRYESIKRDYERLGQILNLSDVLPVERKNSNRNDYRKVYSNKMIDIVSDMYEKDIRRLGYSFE